jgi:predicted GNAT family N-acyltransferase
MKEATVLIFCKKSKRLLPSFLKSPSFLILTSRYKLKIKNMQVLPIEFGTPEHDESIRLRYDVLRRPLGIGFSADALAAEYKEFHLGFYDEQSVLRGILLLAPYSETVVKMRQVAVDTDCQRQGVGRQLVAFSEVFAKSKGFSKIMLHARLVAVPFYEKLNYTIFGEPFEEVGIPHRMMEKFLN